MSNTKKVGSMAVTSFDFDAWFKSEKVCPNNLQKNNKKFNKKVIYPLFLTYAELTSDIYWVKKFHLWANGKLPKGFVVNNNVITFNKGPIWEATNNDQEDASSCIQFFIHYG